MLKITILFLGEISKLCHVIGESLVVTPISIDPHSVYHFGYPLFRSLPDLTTKVNSFDDLIKVGFFIKSTAGVIMKYYYKLFTRFILGQQ